MRLTEEHVERLTGKIFKILPLVQDKSPTVASYIDSVIFELKGLSRSFSPSSKQYSMLRTIYDTLKEVEARVLSNELDKESVSAIRREILNSTTLFGHIFRDDS